MGSVGKQQSMIFSADADRVKDKCSRQEPYRTSCLDDSIRIKYGFCKESSNIQHLLGKLTSYILQIAWYNCLDYLKQVVY